MVGTHTVDETDLLIDLLRRSSLLEELQQGSLDRRELQERLAVSRATSHRHTRLLGELGLIEKEGGEFALTEVGELLTKTLVTFKTEAGSVLQLAPVLEAVRDAPIEIDAEAFNGATVTRTDRGDPYSPVRRFVTLIQETDTLRGLDMDAIAPIYMDEIVEHIVDGVETQNIGVPSVTEEILTGYPDRCIEACASGYLTAWLHDDLPFALAIFDDRVGIGVCETDTRNLHVFVDTDSPKVREWACAVFESYEKGAVRIEEYTLQGFRQALEEGLQTA
ncbi:helix-turn-helix transcriptional regulator [Haladaptatus sp. NG-SE-30]